MLPRTATLEADEGDAKQRRDEQQPQQKAGGAMKFAYKTGSRPLDGYRINRGVGVGGFGEVYLAVTDAGKEVALKRIQRNLDVEIRGVSQCLNLKHPNLISLYDLKYDDEGQAWVIMEYVSGESLKDLVDRNPNGLPQDEAIRWFKEIAAGVDYLHSQGIVHRDLKPANIFDDAGVVKIGDYGLSKLISASRRSGQTESVGTFHYMAPEIGRGVYGKGIDIYALGIILFEMLTGSVPFEGETSQEIIMKHLTDTPDTSAIPEPYCTVIQRALRKDPAKRFGSVQEMLQTLSGNATAADTPALAIGSHGDGKREPIYIGDQADTDGEEIVFGPVRHHAVVATQAVPPVRRSNASGPANVGRPAPRAVVGCGTSRRDSAGAGKTLLKIATILLLVLLVAIRPEALPLVAVIAGAYLVYALFRAVFCRRHASLADGRRTCDRSDPVWRKEVRQAIRGKLVSERFAELTGSMLFSAITAGILTLVALLLEGKTLDGSVSGWAIFAWLTVTGVAGSWILLTLGKFWEVNEGDHFVRRFVMLLAGLAVGLLAYGASEAFMVKLPDHDRWTAHAFPGDDLVGSIYSPDGTPLIAAYLIYFAGLFAILRWWTQMDPLRTARLSLTATAACVLWAWIMHMFLPFPQPWGFMLAAIISVATQLSSPWVRTGQLQVGRSGRET